MRLGKCGDRDARLPLDHNNGLLPPLRLMWYHSIEDARRTVRKHRGRQVWWKLAAVQEWPAASRTARLGTMIGAVWRRILVMMPACGSGIVVVRRKRAGAGWRAGFEAALRGRWGLADLTSDPTGWPPAHPFRSGVRVCVLLRALSNFWLHAKMDGVGQEYVRWVYLGRVR